MTCLSTRILMTTVAVAAATGALFVCTGAAAMAGNAGPVASVVNADDPSKATGTNIDPVQITAPAACNSAATRHVTKITAVTPAHAVDRAAAKAWVGDNLYATASVGLPGPLTVQSSNSWQGLADGFGQKLVPGRYDLVLRCQNNVGTKIYQEWHARVTFSSRTAWRGSVAGSNKGGGAGDDATAPGGKPASGGATPSPATGSGGTTATSPPPTGEATPSGSPSQTAAGAAAADRNDGAASGEAVKGISLAALLVVAGAATTVGIRRARREDSTGQNNR